MLPLYWPNRDGKRISIGIPDHDEVELRRWVAEYAAAKKAREPVGGSRAAIAEIVGRRPDLAVYVPSEITESMR
jgi:hypothetical protein